MLWFLLANALAHAASGADGSKNHSKWLQTHSHQFRTLALREGLPARPLFPANGELIKWSKTKLTVSAVGTTSLEAPKEFVRHINNAAARTALNIQPFGLNYPRADINIIYVSSMTELTKYEGFFRSASNTQEEFEESLSELVSGDLGCYTKLKLSDAEVHKAVVVVPSFLEGGLRRSCLDIVAMGALGLSTTTGKQFNSVLSVHDGLGLVTPLDQQILEIIYRSELLPGMKWAEIKNTLSVE